MFVDLTTRFHSYHQEYVRRHVNPPEPLEPSRQGWRQAIGQSLIHLGERLADSPRPPIDRAA